MNGREYCREKLERPGEIFTEQGPNSSFLTCHLFKEAFKGKRANGLGLMLIRTELEKGRGYF